MRTAIFSITLALGLSSCAPAVAAADSQALELKNYVHDCARLKPRRMQAVIRETAAANNKPVKSEENLWDKLFYVRYTESTKAARDLAHRSVKEHPTWAVPHLYLANELYLDMNDSAALGEVNKALALRPNFVNALILRAELYRKSGKEKSAIVDADKALKSAKQLNKVIMLEEKARALFALNDFAGCLPVCQQAIKEAPGQTAMEEMSMQCYLGMSNYKKALELSNARLRRDPYCAFCHYVKGLALHNLGRDREALPEFTAVLKNAGDRRIEGYVKKALVARADAYDKLKMKSLADADRKTLSGDSEGLYKDTMFLRHD